MSDGYLIIPLPDGTFVEFFRVTDPGGRRYRAAQAAWERAREAEEQRSALIRDFNLDGRLGIDPKLGT